MITQLFRTESLDDKSRLLGEIILVRPLSFTFFAFGGLFFTLAIIIFIAVTDYTSKVSIRGQLQPEAGLIVVEASQTGVVVSRQVAEGQSVAAKEVIPPF